MEFSNTDHFSAPFWVPKLCTFRPPPPPEAKPCPLDRHPSRRCRNTSDLTLDTQHGPQPAFRGHSLPFFLSTLTGSVGCRYPTTRRTAFGRSQCLTYKQTIWCWSWSWSLALFWGGGGGKPLGSQTTKPSGPVTLTCEQPTILCWISWPPPVSVVPPPLPQKGKNHCGC